MAMNVVATQSENECMPKALFELPLAPPGSEGGVVTKLEVVLGAGVGKATPFDVVPGVLATRMHSPMPSPPDTMLQYASNPSHVLVHLAIIQATLLSPSHSSKGTMLEAALHSHNSTPMLLCSGTRDRTTAVHSSSELHVPKSW